MINLIDEDERKKALADIKRSCTFDNDISKDDGASKKVTI